MKVEGMTCGGCASTVRRALQDVKGVESATVDLKAGEAEIIFDDTFADPRTFAHAIKQSGYEPVFASV